MPSGYPQNIEAGVVSSRISTLSWDPPNYEDRNGVIIGYVINVTNTRRSEVQTNLAKAQIVTHTSPDPLSL